VSELFYVHHVFEQQITNYF